MKITQQGFSLIELMIVVAIIGIISGIAYPSYQETIRKSKRKDIQAEMLNVAGLFEREYTKNGSYTAILNDPTVLTYSEIDNDFYTMPAQSAKNYSFRVNVVASPPSFELFARPEGELASSKDGPMLLTSSGQRGWAKGEGESFKNTNGFNNEW
jgi:type IV pilus assembly protein PilE